MFQGIPTLILKVPLNQVRTGIPENEDDEEWYGYPGEYDLGNSLFVAVSRSCGKAVLHDCLFTIQVKPWWINSRTDPSRWNCPYELHSPPKIIGMVHKITFKK